MTIGSLFIALGFDIRGAKDFDEVDKGISRAAGNASKLTLAVGAINVALLAMLDTASKAGMALQNFAISTGLSTDNLQRWQHAAAVAGLDANTLTAAVKSLQDARSAFALGEPQAVGAWSILGVDPTQDPFKVIEQLRASILKIKDAGVARALLGKVGLEGLTPLLRSPQRDFEAWKKAFLIPPESINQLARLNAAWESLKRSMLAVKNLFAAALAPAFTTLARLLEWVASGLAKFSDWLSRGGIVATIVRWSLSALALALLALGVGLAVVTAAFGFLVAGIALLSPALVVALPAMIAMLGYASAIAAVLTGLVFIIDDIITSLSGGQAVTRTIGEWLAGFTLIRESIEGIWRTWDDAVKHFKEGIAIFERLFSKLPAWMTGVTNTPAPMDNRGQAWFTPGLGGVASRAAQENKIDIHVDGARSPEATGREIAKTLKTELAAASYQAPVPNY